MRLKRSQPLPLRASRRAGTILLAVTGMSPAVLTETVWALADDESAPTVPDEVLVLTTVAGKKEIENQLFSPASAFSGQCVWDSLRDALAARGHNTADRLRFDPTSDDVRVFTLWDETIRRRTPLHDIRTRQDNDAVADSILEVVRSIVENPDTRLVASIAGGRKTMGTLLYACMNLLGRETDHLTHVLVDEPFDDPRLQPKFYFPGQPANAMVTPDGKAVAAADARIMLADVPFVPLRNLFEKEFARKPGSFLGLVDHCREDIRQRMKEKIELVVRRSRAEIAVNGIPIRTSPREQLMMLFLAENAVGSSPWEHFVDVEDAVNEFRKALIREAPKGDFSDWRHHESLREPIQETSADHIRKLFSSLRRKLSKKGGPPTALAKLLPEKGRVTLDLPAGNVEIVA